MQTCLAAALILDTNLPTCNIRKSEIHACCHCRQMNAGFLVLVEKNLSNSKCVLKAEQGIQRWEIRKVYESLKFNTLTLAIFKKFGYCTHGTHTRPCTLLPEKLHFSPSSVLVF